MPSLPREAAGTRRDDDVGYRGKQHRSACSPIRAPRRCRASHWSPRLIGTALQSLERVLHTASAVDHAHLVAGHDTPVLTARLALAVPVYPLFAMAIIGLIVVTGRDRSLGSGWIGWLGIAGALGHGAAAPLAIVLGVPWARMLFPLIVLLALWFVLAGIWPLRSAARYRQNMNPVGV